MALVLRQVKGSKLTIQEMDGNLQYLEGLTTQLGWERYFDSVDTEISPQILTAGIWNVITINGSSSIVSQKPIVTGAVPLWSVSENEIKPISNGDTYDMRIDFLAKISNANGFFNLGIDVGGDIGVLQSTTSVFPKGADIEEPFSLTNKIYTAETFLLNGGKIVIKPSHTMEIYSKSVFIERTYAAR